MPKSRQRKKTKSQKNASRMARRGRRPHHRVRESPDLMHAVAALASLAGRGHIRYGHADELAREGARLEAIDASK
jgi:hypothetical protein